MKTAISIPDPLFEAAERLAKRLRISRSQLYQRAVADYLRQHEQQGITEKLDALYETESSRLDPILDALQGASLVKEDW